MANPAKIQIKVNKGWRKEAGVLGQLWDVVRDDVLVKAGARYIVTKWIKSNDIEASTASYFYRARGDRQNLKVGDELVGHTSIPTLENPTEGERYTIVSERLLRDTMAVRTDIPCRIFRPKIDVPDFFQDNTYGAFTARPENCLAAVRTGSTWAWEDADSAAESGTVVYTGITFGRLADYRNPKETPLSTDSLGYILTLKLLPGIILRESDLFIQHEIDPFGMAPIWYRVHRAYRQENSAFMYQMQATMLLA